MSRGLYSVTVGEERQDGTNFSSVHVTNPGRWGVSRKHPVPWYRTHSPSLVLPSLGDYGKARFGA